MVICGTEMQWGAQTAKYGRAGVCIEIKKSVHHNDTRIGFFLLEITNQSCFAVFSFFSQEVRRQTAVIYRKIFFILYLLKKNAVHHSDTRR